MQDVLAPLDADDYVFLVGLLESNVNFSDDAGMRRRLEVYREEPTPEHRAALDGLIEREVRYLGSADTAYLARTLMGREPGVSFREVVHDAARALKVLLPHTGTDRELVEDLVSSYAANQFATLSPEQQQQMLVDLGVDRDEARRFLLKSAGVFSVPLLVSAFDAIVVQGLIKNIIFGTIARFVGKQLSARLFTLLAGRLPWWVGWIGPAAWTLSIGWTALDLQGPALRKTVPSVLFLGLCALREGTPDGR